MFLMASHTLGGTEWAKKRCPAKNHIKACNFRHTSGQGWEDGNFALSVHLQMHRAKWFLAHLASDLGLKKSPQQGASNLLWHWPDSPGSHSLIRINDLIKLTHFGYSHLVIQILHRLNFSLTHEVNVCWVTKWKLTLQSRNRETRRHSVQVSGWGS